MGVQFDFDRFATGLGAAMTDSLGRFRSSPEMVRAMKKATEIAERELELYLDPAEKARIACRAGCGTCCTVNVAVLLPEAIRIAGYIRGRFGGGSRKLEERIDALASEIRWLDEEERAAMRRPCAFLDDEGACSIYEVRPLLCRSVTSADSEECREAFAARVFGEERGVLMNIFQKTLMERAFLAVAKVLDDLGIDSRGLELTAAVKEQLKA